MRSDFVTTVFCVCDEQGLFVFGCRFEEMQFIVLRVGSACCVLIKVKELFFFLQGGFTRFPWVGDFASSLGCTI